MASLLEDGNIEILSALFASHTVQVSPQDDLVDGQIYATKADTNVLVSINETTGAITLTPTSDDVTQRRLLSDRRLLQEGSAGIEGITQTGDESQVGSALCFVCICYVLYCVHAVRAEERELGQKCVCPLLLRLCCLHTLILTFY